jgi:hypothetical protein
MTQTPVDRIGYDEAAHLIRRIKAMAEPHRKRLFAQCAAKACPELVARKQRERAALYDQRRAA